MNTLKVLRFTSPFSVTTSVSLNVYSGASFQFLDWCSVDLRMISFTSGSAPNPGLMHSSSALSAQQPTLEKMNRISSVGYCNRDAIRNFYDAIGMKTV